MSSRGRAFRSLEVDGFEILVGRGGTDNDTLTFRVARPSDFWLHVNGFAGSHVVVRNSNGDRAWDDVPAAVRHSAAEAAIWHSKARAARGKLEVHVCRVADVHKPTGLAPGEVCLRRFQTVRLYPPRISPEPQRPWPDARETSRPRRR